MNVINVEENKKDIQQQLAKERTETAHRRTLLAEERTYSAWIRTGLASLATGFAIAKLMADSGPTWMIRSLGILFITAGGVMFALAFWAYRGALQQMQRPNQGGIPIWIVGILTFTMLVGAATGLAFILIE